MVEMHCFAAKIRRGRRLVDAADVPAVGFICQDSFEFCIMVKRHSFYSTIRMMKEKVLEQLDSTSLPYRIIEHVAVYHVGDEPPELVGFPMTKNLLLKDRTTGQVYMIVMEGEKRLDIAALAVQLVSTKNRLQFVKFDDVEATVGVPPGHVSVFNLLNGETEGVRIVFDEVLLQKSEIGFHPNVNTATIAMRPHDVVAFLKLQGHEPQIVNL